MRPRRILVVQTAYLGDLVLTTPLLDEIRRRHPAASVHLVTTSSGASLLANDPRVDSIDSYHKRQSPSGVASLVRLVRRVRSLAPDVAVAAQRSWRSGLLVRASGARHRVGFAGAAGAWAYTSRVPWDAAAHQSVRYTALATGQAPAAGPVGRDATPVPRLHLQPSALGASRRRLLDVGIAADQRWLCLAPGSARSTKRWPAAHFARLARLAASRGLPTCLVGAPSERALAERIRRAAGGAPPASLVGCVPLGELPALISCASVLVGNDSAPAHIAAAVGTPLVSIFGPTAPEHGYAPLGPTVRIVGVEQLSCRPCSPRGPRRCPRGDLACLTTLDASRVLDAVEQLVGSTRSGLASSVS